MALKFFFEANGYFERPRILARRKNSLKATRLFHIYPNSDCLGLKEKGERKISFFVTLFLSLLLHKSQSSGRDGTKSRFFSQPSLLHSKLIGVKILNLDQNLTWLDWFEMAEKSFFYSQPLD